MDSFQIYHAICCIAFVVQQVSLNPNPNPEPRPNPNSKPDPNPDLIPTPTPNLNPEYNPNDYSALWEYTGYQTNTIVF